MKQLLRHVPQQTATPVTKDSSPEDKAKLAQDLILKKVAKEGRRGDTVLGHLSIGDTIIPRELINFRVSAILQKILKEQHGQFTVGNVKNSINPKTGLREFDDGGAGSDSSAEYDSGDFTGSGTGADPLTAVVTQASADAVNTDAEGTVTSNAAPGETVVPNQPSDPSSPATVNWTVPDPRNVPLDPSGEGPNALPNPIPLDAYNQILGLVGDNPTKASESVDALRRDFNPGNLKSYNPTQGQIKYATGYENSHSREGEGLLANLSRGLASIAPALPILTVAGAGLSAGLSAGAFAGLGAGEGAADAAASGIGTDAFGTGATGALAPAESFAPNLVDASTLIGSDLSQTAGLDTAPSLLSEGAGYLKDADQVYSAGSLANSIINPANAGTVASGTAAAASVPVTSATRAGQVASTVGIGKPPTTTSVAAGAASGLGIPSDPGSQSLADFFQGNASGSSDYGTNESSGNDDLLKKLQANLSS